MSISVDPAISDITAQAGDRVADQVADQDVEDSRPAACWSVVEGAWRDELPVEVAALLAPPVVVSAERFAVADNVKTTVYAAPRRNRGAQFS